MKPKLATLILSSFILFFIFAITLLFFQQKYLFLTDFKKLSDETEAEVARIAKIDFTNTANTLAQLVETELRSMKTNALLIATDIELQLKIHSTTKTLPVRALFPHIIQGLRYSSPSSDDSFVFASQRSDFRGNAYRLIQLSDHASAMMAVMKKQHPAYHLIYITTKNHMVRMYPKADMKEVVATQALRPDFNVNDFVFYEPAAPEKNPSGEFRWSPIYPAEMSKNWLISAMQPIHFQGEFLGVVTIDLRVPQLLDEARRQAAARGFDLLLLNKEGDVFGSSGFHSQGVLPFAHSFEKRSTSEIKNPQIREALQKSASDQIKFSELKEEQLFLAAGSIPQLGLKLVLLTDQKTFGALATQLLKKTQNRVTTFFEKQLISAALALVLIFTLLTFIFSFLMRPLSDIQEALKSIGRGHLDIRTSKQRVLEFQEMSEGVNQMAQQILVNQLVLEHNAADAARGKLSRQLAHDLRSPLSALKMSIQMLNSECKKDADLMNRAIEKMDQIIFSLLPEKASLTKSSTLSRSTDTTDGDLEILDLHHSLEEVLEQMRSTESKNRIRFERQYSPLTLRVQHRRLDLYRILVNIVQNAMESIPEDEPGTIVFMTQISKQDPTRFEVRIRDSGCGIPEEISDSIFMPDFTHGKRNGSGQGLAIVKDLVEKNGGSVRFESVKSNGTTFILNYPLAPNESRFLKSPPILSGSEQGLSISDEEQLVVIEDDPLVQDHWRLLTRSLHCQTLFYANWESFVTDFPVRQTMRPVFVIDFNLSQSTLNGIEIYKELSKDYPRSRFYMCSGELWDESFRKQIESLSLPYISKPLPDDFELRTPTL